ncbi:hypothetical protein Q4E93_28050 [Flavitalea sp. BT771]|uniref:hypothetical protein n=1 Tax=Flavitalea sp. BT771 TaxID=3063329 RepID=UPI0026E2734A|nr:hypothetical protein [Flavitalea sp. BT771]MDO6434497.1 hypothetical protein [Flavitalea sp. BT771]MDV6223397.1 hypothetical protein [Flavitalea sp. BT771]
MFIKAARIFAVCCGLAVLIFSVLRDIHYDKEFPGDLRNRIVGARMIEDGHSPYFYKWRKGDGLRYYDPTNFDTVKPSACTSTPFIHHLLRPLADQPQAKISQYWLVLEYLILTAMTLFAFYHATTRGQKWAVLAIALLFLLTNAWKCQVSHGQTYLLIPAFATVLFACLRRRENIGWALLGGLAAACMMLIRPYAVLFFLPLLLHLRTFPRKWLLAFLIPGLLLTGWIITSRWEYSLWQDYARMLQEHLKIAQDLPHDIQYNEPDPHYPHWEGIDQAITRDAMAHTLSKVYSENGNIFVLYRLLLHRKLPVAALAVLSLGTILTLTTLFYRRNCTPRPGSTASDLTRMAIFGFCLYMIADLFSPIYRHQYYTVQWIFPLLLAGSIWSPRWRTWYIAMAAGLLLSIIHLPFLKMANTVGEYMILLALLAISGLSPENISRKSRQ